MSQELRRRMVAEGFEEILAWRFRTQSGSEDMLSVQSLNGTPAQTPAAPPIHAPDAPLVQPSNTPPDAPPMEPSAEKDDEAKKTVDAAERQRTQTLRDEIKGWARCYAKAPDDPDAREIVAMVAKAIISPPIRKAVRVAVAHPEYVFMGEKVAGLSGFDRPPLSGPI